MIWGLTQDASDLGMEDVSHDSYAMRKFTESIF